MKLVIVESPSKASTINSYLGKDYKVIASYGHIRKLISKSGSVEPSNHFKMRWEETPQGKKYLKGIIDNIKKSSELYLATDPDREGEAISWHLVEYLKEHKIISSDYPIKRVIFHSITKQSILEAFENSKDLNDDLINAYLTRVALDYLVGFGISPILWRKLPGSRSAGRVQSVALRLICERQNEIDDFKPQEYWSINGLFTDDQNHLLDSKLVKFDNKNLGKMALSSKQQVDEIIEQINTHNFLLASKNTKNLTKKPFAPFQTSTLQQDAFNKLGFSAKKTMMIAQNLYEGIKLKGEKIGLITYMRTDAININPNFITSMRSFIKQSFGEKYLPQKPIAYKTKTKNAQEAHEAIRPTTITHDPKSVRSFLTDEQMKLYTLIWNRTIASQMSNALYEVNSLHIDSKDQSISFKCSSSILIFDGFYKIYRIDNDKEDMGEQLPNIPLNTYLILKETNAKQHFTEPPARYTEASLVKMLEDLGIGRPSTYANIISVLQERQYVIVDKKRFIPEPRGRILNVFLSCFFSKYVEYDFTANLEADLDNVATGQTTKNKVLSLFWKHFHENLDQTSNKPITDIITKINEVALKHFVGKNDVCPKCTTGKLKIMNSKFGAFLGCSNYPDCTYNKPLEVNSEDSVKSQIIFQDDDGIDLLIKNGPYGYYVEKVLDKPKRTAIPKNIDPQKITQEQAKMLISLPKKLTKDITLGIGRFGPYIKMGNEFFSVKEDLFNITEKRALEIIQESQQKKLDINLGKHDKYNKDILLKNGRFGSYISYDGRNIKIPKAFKNAQLSLEQAIKIINDATTVGNK